MRESPVPLEEIPPLSVIPVHPSLNAVLHGITSPVVVVNAAGGFVAGSPSGQAMFHQCATLDPERLGIAPLAQEKPPHLFQGCLQGFLQGRCPTVLPWDTRTLLRITPLPDGLGLLEWVTDGGDESLEMFQEISQAVNSSLILEEIFEALGEALYRQIPYQEATIVILDDSQNRMKVLVRIQENGALEITGEHNTFTGYDPVLERLLSDPTPLQYVRPEPIPDSLVLSNPAETQTLLVVPLVNKGRVIGLIALASAWTQGFPRAQQGLLVQVSEQLAVAVENAKLYWQTQTQASREFLINQLTKAIRQSLETAEILSTAVEELGRVIGVSRCIIHYFAGDAPPQVFQYTLLGVSPMPFPENTPPLEQRVFQLRKDQTLNPFILNDVRDCPPVLTDAGCFEANGIKSLAIFPILVRDTLVGTLTLHQCEAYRAWILEDIELMRAIAEHLSVALHQAELFQVLESQKSTLEKTLAELQQTQIHLIQSEKMAILGQFVAGIAHEVNTPLGTMTSNNATLRSCVAKLRREWVTEEGAENPASPPPVLDAMEELLSLNKLASERIQEIVKNLRNFARLDESELKTVDIHDGIESTLLVMRGSFKPNVKIHRRYNRELPPVRCYPGLLNQVFMNLLVNATHALEDTGGGDIVIETRLSVPEAEGATTMLEIVFQDTGKGIAPEHLAKIFDPGFTTKGVGVGTGLGLALCYKIVEKHHGEIQVESAPGHGAYFQVRIPLTG